MADWLNVWKSWDTQQQVLFAYCLKPLPFFPKLIVFSNARTPVSTPTHTDIHIHVLNQCIAQPFKTSHREAGFIDPVPHSLTFWSLLDHCNATRAPIGP